MTRAVDSDQGGRPDPIKYAYDVEQWQGKRKGWVAIGTAFSHGGAQAIRARYYPLGKALQIQKRIREPDEQETQQQGELF